MKNSKRTDAHSPSNIVPTDYDYLCCDYYGDLGVAGIHNPYFAERETLRNYLKQGHKRVEASEVGTCDCCGAQPLSVSFYIHKPTGDVLRLGWQCANKVEIGDNTVFKKWQKINKDVRKRVAGKAKAKALLEDMELADLWARAEDKKLFVADDFVFEGVSKHHMKNYIWKSQTLASMVSNFITYGKMSEKQEAFARKLWAELKEISPADLVAKTKADEAAQALVPDLENGRYEITGTVISIKEPDEYAQFPSWKMLVKIENGCKIFGSIPSKLEDVSVGEKISFTAKITRSDNDSKFGFYSRPTKPSFVDEEENVLS